MKHLTTDKLLSLGMALHADKRTMEHRVRSIFARRHSAWFASIAAVMLCGAIGVLGFTTACQPAEETIEEASLDQAESQVVFSVPARWEETVETQDVSYVFAAEIQHPNVAAYPVVEMIPRYFDFAILDRIVETFVPEHRMQIEDIDVLTKEQIQAEMDVIQQSIENVDRNHPEFSAEDRETYLADRQEDLAYMQQMHDAAPQVLEATEIGSTSEMYSKTSTRTSARVYNAAGEAELICEMHMTHGDDRVAMFSVFPLKAYDTETCSLVPIAEMPIPRIEIDRALAAARADTFVKQIGMDTMYSLNCVYEDMGFYEGVIAVYTPTYAGVQTTYAIPAVLPTKTENLETFRLWPAETVLVYLDANCNVCRFSWNYPSEAGAVETQNANLLPFDTVHDRMKSALQQMQPDMPYWEGIEHRKIVIDRITLGMMRVKNTDTDGYHVIPVWDCFGHLVDRYASEEDSEYRLNENMEAVIDENDGVGSFLTISALDGSIIDRKLGY